MAKGVSTDSLKGISFGKCILDTSIHNYSSLGLKLHSAEFRAVAQYQLSIPLYSVAGA
jgi:hypothetical protein